MRFVVAAQADEDRELRPVLPVLLGGGVSFDTMPHPLPKVQGIVISEGAYAAGPEASSRELDDVALAVDRLVAPRDASAVTESGSERATRLEIGGTARTALDYAAGMLRHHGRTEAQRRTAALLGALIAAPRVSSTTGQVVELLAQRLTTKRNLDEAIAQAAEAAGLFAPMGLLRMKERDELKYSRGWWAPLEGHLAEVCDRTGAQAVHLRHVVAVGLHPSVPERVFAELGLPLPELRASWIAAIRSSPLDEAGEDWTLYLTDVEQEDISHGRVASPPPPSARVHADRWTVEDRLDYSLYAKAIAEFIRHPDATPPMVISVQAPWGQGKTSLMRMVQADLDPHHPDLEADTTASTEGLSSKITFEALQEALGGKVPLGDIEASSIRSVWFNAWKYQSSEQIWAGLAHAILAQLPARLPRKDRELFWLRLQCGRIDPAAVRENIYRATLEWFLPKLAGKALLAFGVLIVLGLALLAGGPGMVGVGVAGAGTIGGVWLVARAWSKAREQALKRPLEGAYLRYVRQPDYSGRLGYLHLVEEDMANALRLLAPTRDPVVIFIDDLDRCSPTNVGEVIEAMNLFLAGEFPRCAFVIGIDAEVVAASMEVVHAEIIEKLDKRRGELGWRFMDKFVQLPFVMPRLHPDQREGYLRGLFAVPSGEEVSELVAQADALENHARDGDMPADRFAERVADLRPRLAAVEPEIARALGEQAVERGAREFSDADPEVVAALAAQLRYLSDNPRTIKRAVNLYRFHHFAAFARRVSTLPVDSATPAQIGRWVVVIVRWPQFVRWLQAERDQEGAIGRDAASRILDTADSTSDIAEFQKALVDGGITASWTGDLELLEFLHQRVDPELRLDLASACGLW